MFQFGGFLVCHYGASATVNPSRQMERMQRLILSQLRLSQSGSLDTFERDRFGWEQFDFVQHTLGKCTFVTNLWHHHQYLDMSMLSSLTMKMISLQPYDL